jgi:hypothetical protein
MRSARHFRAGAGFLGLALGSFGIAGGCGGERAGSQAEVGPGGATFKEKTREFMQSKAKGHAPKGGPRGGPGRP